MGVEEPFVIGIFLFTMFMALPIVMNMGTVTTQQVLANNPGLNATQTASINHFSNTAFVNSPDIILATMYFLLILASFIAAAYEGANPAVTLVVGLFFIVIAEIISFGISDVAHAYIMQPAYLNTVKHLSITLYIMEYLPFFNGVLTIAYIIFVITKREVIVSGLTSGGGGGSVISV